MDFEIDWITEIGDEDGHVKRVACINGPLSAIDEEVLEYMRDELNWPTGGYRGNPGQRCWRRAYIDFSAEGSMGKSWIVTQNSCLDI